MIELLKRLESELIKISGIDKVRPISKINELKGFHKYALTYEIIGDKNFKQRKGKNESPIFINCYANVDNGDMAVLWLMEQVKGLLDEANLTNSTIKTFFIKYQSCTPQPEKNRYLQAWQSVIKFIVRWEKR